VNSKGAVIIMQKEKNETSLVLLKDLGLVKKEDMEFLLNNSENFQDRYARSSLFRSKFEMEASVLNDMVHPTIDSKYWQAIGEQAVHVKELIRLGHNGKKTEAEIKLFKAIIEELKDLKEQAIVDNKPQYVIDKYDARIDKKQIEIEEKKFSLTECEKVAKERIKEIKNWEEIIPELEKNLKHGKEDWEAHHPERSLLRNEISMRNFNLLETDAKKNAVRDFTAAVQHPSNKELVKERRQMLTDAGAGQQVFDQVSNSPKLEENKEYGHPIVKPDDVKRIISEQTTTSTNPTSNPNLSGFAVAAQNVVRAKNEELSTSKQDSDTQILEQPKESALVDYKSKEELTKNDPIARKYFNRKVTRIMVATPHRFQSEVNKNVTNFDLLQMPAAVDSHIEQPWGFSVPDARNFCVEKAFELGADYIFFVDDDTIIPRNALVQLYRLNSDLCGGMYYRKYLPSESVPMLEAPDTTPYAFTTNDPFGEVIHNCLVLPSGCTLIKTSMLKKMEKPWYKTFTVNNRPAVTEDTYICQKARDLGVDILLDTGIQCLHVDKQNLKLYGHADIVDPKTNTINTKYANYFAADFIE
jgi:hypothetical protein